MHNSVTVDPEDPKGTERLARYPMRPPLSLERMSFDEQGCVLYQPKPSRRFAATQTLDPADFLARLLMDVPEPRRHLVAYFGHYTNRVRARRQAQARELNLTPDRSVARKPAPSDGEHEDRGLR